MDKNTEFKWNDKLVQDYIQFYAASYAASVAYFNSDETLEKFKQSKSKKEEPQWEILEYKNTTNGDVFTFQSVCNNSIYSDGFKDNTSEFSRQDCFIIESVKRFPDNTVWSVDGSYFINGYMATLKRFELSENGKMIVYFNGLNIGYELSELPTEKAPKEEQVPIDKLLGSKEAFDAGYSMGYKDANKYNDKKYSESELLQARRDAFYAGRSFDCWNVSSHQYAKFEDYINSLK